MHSYTIPSSFEHSCYQWSIFSYMTSSPSDSLKEMGLVKSTMSQDLNPQLITTWPSAFTTWHWCFGCSQKTTAGLHTIAITFPFLPPTWITMAYQLQTTVMTQKCLPTCGQELPGFHTLNVYHKTALKPLELLLHLSKAISQFTSTKWLQSLWFLFNSLSRYEFPICIPLLVDG